MFYESAAACQCRPWELAGFSYDDLGTMPICWREWGLDFTFTKVAVQNENMRRMAGG